MIFLQFLDWNLPEGQSMVWTTRKKKINDKNIHKMCSSTANIEKNKKTKQNHNKQQKNTYKHIQNITTENFIQQHN